MVSKTEELKESNAFSYEEHKFFVVCYYQLDQLACTDSHDKPCRLLNCCHHPKKLYSCFYNNQFSQQEGLTSYQFFSAVKIINRHNSFRNNLFK